MKESWEGEFQHFIRNEDEADLLWFTVEMVIKEAGKKELLANPKILDIGGRQGEFSKFLNSKGIKAVSIDLLKVDHNQGAEQVQANIHKLPFQNESFNIIVANSVFDDLLYKFNYSTVIKEIARVLEPNGIFIMLASAINSHKVPELSEYFSRIDTPFTKNLAFSEEEAILWQKK